MWNAWPAAGPVNSSMLLHLTAIGKCSRNLKQREFGHDFAKVLFFPQIRRTLSGISDSKGITQRRYRAHCRRNFSRVGSSWLNTRLQMIVLS
jgi:hypothetical protein